MPQSPKIPAELVNLATTGNSAAQFELAELYMQSENEDDITLAEEWALKAAALGHVEAMYWLGEGYAFYAKELREEDPSEAETYFGHAHHWLKQAAELKHPTAILELAGFYRRGDVVDKDVAKSIELVQQAAELGEAQAMRDLAFIYENALGIDADEVKAKYWHNKADAVEQCLVLK